MLLSEAHISVQRGAVDLVIDLTGGSPYVGLTSADWEACFPLSSTGAAAPLAGAHAPPREDQRDPPDVRAAVLNAAFDKGLTEVAPRIAQRGAGILAGAVAGLGVGGLPGFAIGVLVNLGWEIISSLFDDGYDERDRREFDAAYSARIAGKAANKRFSTAGRVAEARILSKIAGFGRCLEDLSDADEVRALGQWARAEAEALRRAASALPSPEAVGNMLLKRWVLQRTAEDGRAERGTSPGTHAAAREGLLSAGASPLELVPTSRGHYLEQLRYLWGRMGLALDAPVAAVEARHGALKDAPAAAVVAALSGVPFDVSAVAAPAAFAARAPEWRPGAAGVPAHAVRDEDVAEAAAKGAFRLTSRVSLRLAGPAVVVETVTYDLLPKPGHDAADADSRSLAQGESYGPWIYARTWDETPNR